MVDRLRQTESYNDGPFGYHTLVQEFAGTDRIVVRHRLGAGGYGVVYHGFDRDRKIPVAIKTLKQLDPDGLTRFKEEFRSLADIAHPNLITLFELMTDGDQWFFTMELVDGVDFLTWVRGEPGWRSNSTGATSNAATIAAGDVVADGEAARSVGLATPLSAAAIGRLRAALRQLAAGIDALHQAGIVHRDIKPSNVLVTAEGRVVLLDFGLAREMPVESAATMAVESNVVGTPAYMAPERARPGAAGPAADWYAVGVILYEALTGRSPFTGSMIDQLLQKQRAEPPPPSELMVSVPPDLDTLCRDLLRTDPADRPAGREILERVGSTPDRPATASTRAAIFVGRAQELGVLETAYERVLQGRPVVVSIHGGPGVGKTALVRRFVERVTERDRSAVAFFGRCYESESVPYKAVDSVLDGLARYLQQLPAERAEAVLPREVGALTRLFPALGGIHAVARAQRRPLDVRDSQEIRRRAFAALRELLGRLADRQPLVIVIDDLQWGDIDSAALLGELLRPPDAPPLLLLVTYRADDAGAAPMLKEFRGVLAEMPSIDARDLPLGELAPDEARDLAGRLLGTGKEGAQAAGSAGEVAAESGGNPLFIAELAQHVRRAPSHVALRGASLEAVIAARVAALPAEARRLVEIVSLAGQPIDVASAFRAAGAAGPDERLIALLRSTRLVRGSGETRWRRVEAYHDRIREVVAAGIAPDAARASHLHIAEALEETPEPDPERLAFHFERAGLVDRAVPWMRLAGDRAMAAVAFDRAAAFYQQVLALRPPADPAERRSVDERLGSALAMAGRGPRAAEALLAAARDAPPDEALDLRRRAAHQYLISGHIDEGLDLLRTVLAAVGLRMAPTPTRALISVLINRLRLRLRGLSFRRRDAAEIPAGELRRIDTCAAAAAGLALVDTIRSSDFYAQHIRLALDAGEPYRVARALSDLVSQVSLAGSRSRSATESVMAKADALVQELGDPYLIAHNDMTCGVAEYMAGRWRAGLVRLQRSENVLREQCTGVAWDLDTCHLYQLRTMFWLGEIAGLCERVPRLVEEAHERGDRLGTTALRARVSYTALLAADDPEAGREASREGIAAWSQRGFHTEHYWDWMAQTEVDLYQGDGAGAWRRVNARWRALQRSLITRVQVVRLQTIDLRARAALAAALGASSEAEHARLVAIAEQDTARIERERVDWAAGLAHRLRASIAIARSQTERAVDALHSSERAFADAGMELHAMAARRRRGRLIGGDEGQSLVDTVDAWMAAQTIRNPQRFAGMFGV